jgi:CheY-like chemotaxis protein
MPGIAKVLVVDDNVSQVRLIEGVLRRQDFDVITAYDGVEALARARHEHPDLIVLDIVMPRLDGYEVCRRLRSDPATAEIPVILLSVKGQVDDPDIDSRTLNERISEQMRGFEVGAVEFIPKPVRAGDLLERIRNHIWIDRMAAQRGAD